MYTTLLFDFDYTLADTSVGIVRCFNHGLKSIGLDEQKPLGIQKTIGMPLYDAFCILTDCQDQFLYDKFKYNFMEASHRHMATNSSLFNSSIYLLRWAKNNGYKVGIVTSKDAPTVLKILGRKCSQYVDIVIGEDETIEQKPNAVPLNLALKMLGSINAEAVYIGDCIMDAQMASNAGIDFWAMLTGTTTVADFSRCGFPVSKIFCSVKHLFDYLKSEV